MAKLNVIFVTFFLILVIRQSSAGHPSIKNILDWTKALFDSLLEVSNNEEVETFASQVNENNMTYVTNLDNLDEPMLQNLNKMDNTFNAEKVYENKELASKVKTAIGNYITNFGKYTNYLPNRSTLNSIYTRCVRNK